MQCPSPISCVSDLSENLADDRPHNVEHDLPGDASATVRRRTFRHHSIRFAAFAFVLLWSLRSTPAAAQFDNQVHVYPFEEGGRIGLMDQEGRILSDPLFDAAERPRGDRIPLRVGARWGLWSATDSMWTIDPSYEELLVTGDTLVAARTADGWTLMTFTGRRLIPAAFHALRDPADGVFPAAVIEDRGPVDNRVRWGVFSVDGDTLVQPRFENLLAFKEGVAAARISRRLLRFIRRSPRWGFTGPDGDWIIRPEFDSARSFSDSLALVSAGGELFFIGPDGDRRFTVEHDLAYSFSEGRARIVDQGLWGWIDMTGRVVVEPAWEGALDFSEGLAAVRRTGRWGYVDRSGRIAIPVQYEAAAPFRGPLAEVVEGGRRIRIDRSGREVAPRSADPERQ